MIITSKSKYLFVTTLAIFITYTISIAVIGLTYSPAASDVAVVLGNEVDINGNPSPRLKARLDSAVNLYKNNLTKNIIVSGGVGKSGYNESVVMAKYLQENSISPNNIIEDPQGENTMATAINTTRIIKEHDFKSVTVVSQYFHLPRCILAFNKAGIKNTSATYPNYFEIRDIFSIIRESIAIPKYILSY
mgnify:CR=1 FL=1